MKSARHLFLSLLACMHTFSAGRGAGYSQDFGFSKAQPKLYILGQGSGQQRFIQAEGDIRSRAIGSGAQDSPVFIGTISTPSSAPSREHGLRVMLLTDNPNDMKSRVKLAIVAKRVDERLKAAMLSQGRDSYDDLGPDIEEYQQGFDIDDSGAYDVGENILGDEGAYIQGNPVDKMELKDAVRGMIFEKVRILLLKN